MTPQKQRYNFLSQPVAGANYPGIAVTALLKILASEGYFDQPFIELGFSDGRTVKGDWRDWWQWCQYGEI
jgi:hypothetical protein